MGPAGPGSASLGAVAAAMIAALLLPQRALAEGLAGEYSVGSQSVSAKVESWGDDCGPQPKSYSQKGKGTVTVTEQGDHLSFSNGQSTQKCWSANPKLQRLSVTKKGNSWTIVCESPAEDSRHEHGTYVVTAGSGAIKVKDTSKYEWKLKESICKATIIIERAYTLVGGAGETAPETAPEPATPAVTAPVQPTIEKEYPEPSDTSKCKKPGPPVKLAISPVSVEIPPGRSVCFSAFMVDANGCRIPTKAEWKLVKENPDREGRLDGNCFHPGDNAAVSEGTFRVLVEFGYETASAKVVVRSQAVEDLIAVNLAPGTEGGEPAASGKAGSGTPSGQIMVPVAGKWRPPPILFYLVPPFLLVLAIGIAVALALREKKRRIRRKLEDIEEERARIAASSRLAPVPGSGGKAHVAGLQADGGMGRQRRQAQAPVTAPPVDRPQASPPARQHAADVPAQAQRPASGGARVCRVCGREYEAGARFCPIDGSNLSAPGDGRTDGYEAGVICPRCGRGYPAGTRNCGEDGEILIPAPAAESVVGRAAPGHADQRRICPICSEVYSDESTFCGKDGVKLVPMN